MRPESRCPTAAKAFRGLQSRGSRISTFLVAPVLECDPRTGRAVDLRKLAESVLHFKRKTVFLLCLLLSACATSPEPDWGRAAGAAGWSAGGDSNAGGSASTGGKASAGGRTGGTGGTGTAAGRAGAGRAGAGGARPVKVEAPPDVQFSLKRGWYMGNQTLTLSSPVPGAVISYAVGGKLPSTAYKDAIQVADNGKVVTVRARMTANGVTGRLHTHSFVFMPDMGGAVVVMNDNGLPVAAGEVERTVTFEFIPSPRTGLLGVADEAGTAPNTSGQSAGTSDKVYFRDEYGKGTLHGDLFSDLYYGVHPTERHDHLFLRSDHTDRSLLRNIMAHDSLLSLGQLSPHGRFVDFYDNGVHKGARYLLERPEGGFMESYTAIDKKLWIAVSGLDSEGTSLLTAFQSWGEVKQTINVHSLVDFLIVQWHAGVRDFLPHLKNWRATGPTGLGGGADSAHRWHFFNWDIDRGYMRDYRTFGSPKDIWERIQQFPEARLIFQDRVQCAFFNGGPMTTPSMMRRVSARLAQVRTTTLTTARGDDLSLDVTLFADTIEAWLLAREALMLQTVLTDFLPSGHAMSSQVTDGVLSLSSPNRGSVYYRLDGGDPRTEDGSLAPTAVLYQGPVRLPSGRNAVVARSFDPNQPNFLERWSPACNEPSVFEIPAGSGSLE